MAVSLQRQSGAAGPLSDLELARQLQQEEYQNQQQGAPTAAPQVTAGRPRSAQQEVDIQAHIQAERSAVVMVMVSLCFQARGQGSQQGGARRRDKDSDCVIL